MPYTTAAILKYELLKKYYQPFNPDQDVTSIEHITADKKASYQQQLFNKVKTLLQLFWA